MKRRNPSIPDTRIECGVEGCTELREPWRLACDPHLDRLPPGVRRLLSADTTSVINGNAHTNALAHAHAIWRAQDLDMQVPADYRPPLTLNPPWVKPERSA